MHSELFSSSTGTLVAEREFSEREEAVSPRFPKALFILEAASRDLIYGPQEQHELEEHADFYAAPQSRESIASNPGLLRDVEVIFSGWGAPTMDKAFLDAAPNLKAVFYGAGSI